MVMGRRVSGGPATSIRPLPPVSSKAKDYTDRPEEVEEELDDLRTRGIAKILNKHFTTTARKLAIEKAQADAALADLERRRAQTKAFVPKKGGELNPYDKLYVQLQQRRAECRRKEKETMMLYQRYVMKYGKSAKAEPLGSAHQEGGSGTELKGDSAGKSTLGTLDENSEITFAKFYEKQENEERERQRQQQKENERNKKNFESALTKFMTASEDEEDDLQPHTTSEPVLIMESPSRVASDVKADPFMSAISKFTKQASPKKGMSTYESSILMQEGEDIQSESRTATPTASEPDFDHGIAVVTPEIKRTPLEDNTAFDVSVCAAEDESMISEQQDRRPTEDVCHEEVFENEVAEESQEEAEHESEFENEVAEKSQEEAEHEPEISEMAPEMAPEAAITQTPSSHQSTPKGSKIVRVDANDESPYFQTATVEGYDFDDRSIISELTSANSAVTRQLMDEVETEMEDFIKFEMEAIRKMLDTEEDNSTVELSVTSDNSSLYLADQSVHETMKAEAMALEMQKILDEFAKEDASSKDGSECISEKSPTQEEEIHEPKSVYPYKFEPAIPGEDWYVHFDENYQKEYYVEETSNRTQWEYPQKLNSPHKQENITSDDFLSDVHSVASSRRSYSTRRSSRRAIYRKQRKKRRARRLAISSLALLSVVFAVIYWQIHQPDAVSLVAFVTSLKNMGLKGAVNSIVDRFEYSFTNRKEREELINLQQAALDKIAKERRARELADQRAKKKAEEEAIRVAKKKAAEEEAARKLAEEQEAAAEAYPGGRPWQCNIPFAYAVPYCWRLSKTQPIFGLKNEKDLTFLQ